MKTALVSTLLFASVVSSQSGAWGQCGGNGWTGPTTCISGYMCTYSNPWYSQCLPGTATSTSATTLVTSTKTTTSAAQSTSTTKSTSTTTSSTSSASATSTSLTKFTGVNIAGFDFGCTTDGTCVLSEVAPPLNNYGGADGAGQMTHFVNDDKLNLFRLPCGWQFLVNNNLGGTLSSSNLAEYNNLVQACLNTGAYCIVDIHNYARWDGGIIGQGGPTNAQFVSLWTQLASYYASESRILFGIMNEPHDLNSITTWADTVQAVVTAIRNAGATSQIILLPGTDYTAASAYISSGSGAALAAVTNPDGTTTNLIFDVHQYLDSDNSGTGECVTNNIANAFQPLATWLESIGRQALLSETGGENDLNCELYLCEQLAFLNENSNVFLGYVGWAAGSFISTYNYVETPTDNNGVWTDQPIVAKCIAR